MSKGSKRRPTNEAAYQRGWAKVFGKRKASTVGVATVEGRTFRVDSVRGEFPHQDCEQRTECGRECEVGHG